MLINTLIISIISSITLLLPISYESHIFILKSIFNTKIFNNNIIINSLNISLAIFLIIINLNNTSKFKKHITIKKQFFNIIIKIFISSTLITLINFLPQILTFNIKKISITLLIISIIIFITTNKKGTKKIKDISYFNSFIFPLFNLLTLFLNISPLYLNLLSSKIIKLDKKNSLFFSTITLIPLYFIKSFPYITTITDKKVLIYLTISIILNIIFMFPIYNYLKNIYYNNKQYKLSIYLIILSIFLLYWFR